MSALFVKRYVKAGVGCFVAGRAKPWFISAQGNALGSLAGLTIAG